MNACADLSFGLNPQAVAVATLLAGRQPDFADYDDNLHSWKVRIGTFPWYNGRERGVAFVVQKDWGSAKALCLVVAECRNSDAIFVEEWEQVEPMNKTLNGPTLAGRDRALGSKIEGVYRNRWSCGEGQVGKAADYIYKRMAGFYAREKKAETVKLTAVGGGK